MSAERVSCLNCLSPAGEPCTAPTDTGRRPIRGYHHSRNRAGADYVPHYLTLADVAERTGLGVESLKTYRKRARRNAENGDPRPGDFPLEDITLGRTPGWLTTTIDHWMQNRPRAGARP